MPSQTPSTINNKPFLKWAGGKHKLVPALTAKLGPAKRLVEPFVGSGAVFMGASYDSYLLCDSNPDLIHLFNYLKFDAQRLMGHVDSLFTTANNTELQYYILRAEFNQAQDLFRKAALFVYLNRHGFNGLCRYNSKGGFNVPFGRYDSPTPPLKEMEVFAQKAALATFMCQSFEDTFELLQPGDVVYCDPPYVPLSATASFTTYGKAGFGNASQILLTEKAIQAQAQGYQVVISNHDTPEVRTLYLTADIHTIEVQRNISSKATTRGKVSEVIAVFA